MTDGSEGSSESRILAATIDELASCGFAGLSMESVAAAAGVGRATIYRHWDSRAALVIAAVRGLGAPASVMDTGDVRADLVSLASALATALSTTPLGAILPVLVEAAHRDPELAGLHDALVVERRADAVALIAAAVRRGDLPKATDGELLLDLVVGPLFYRHLVLRRPASPFDVVALVDAAVDGATGGPPRP